MSSRRAQPAKGAPAWLRTAVRRAVGRVGVVSRVASATRRRRGASAIRRSGWFDEAWYREQAGTDLPADTDPIGHFVTVGAARGLQPHPLFDPGHYLDGSRRARASTADPFTEFVERGARRGDDPHPLFDTATYLRRAPEAATHPGGAFGHFLEIGQRDRRWPTTDLTAGVLPDAWQGDRPYLEAARRAWREHRAVPDHRALSRTSSTFDHRGAEAFVTRTRRLARDLDDPPLVTVITPTRDRAAVLPVAIESVLAQRYGHWEQIVVDDGGTDDTAEVVAAYGDERIRYLHQGNTGAAGARNHGMREARGHYIAYLDSDNHWVPEYLETMVAFLVSERLRVAYAGIELRTADGVEYRDRPLDVEALRERNYIDLNTVMHERSLGEQIGGFDDRLRRVVDWDLLIRIAEVTDIGYAPFLGAHYDHTDDRSDRITTTESVGYRYVVRDKHLVDWDAAPEMMPGRLTVVLVVRAHVATAVERLLQLDRDLADRDHELVVVDVGLGEVDALRLRLLASALPAMALHRIADPLPTTVARNLAAAAASGEVLVFLDPAVVLDRSSLDHLVAACDDLALAQPSLLDSEGTIRSTGQRLGPATTPVTIGSQLAEGDLALAGDLERDGVEGFAFAARADAFRSLHGFDALFVRGGSDLDLGLRAAEAGLRSAWVPEASGWLRRRETDEVWTPSPADARELRRRWHDRSPGSLDPGHLGGLGDLDGLEVVGLEPLPSEALKEPKRWAPVLARSAGGGAARRWAIKICAGDVSERDQWGDWHVAVALKAALERLGEHAVVDCRRAWYRPTASLDDVTLFLRGTRPFEPVPSQTSLCWIISHPERVTWDELVRYDHVFAASLSFPDELVRRHPDLAGRVSPLLQCTDPSRFYPDPVPELAEQILFVGNSRGMLRPIVRDAIAAGLRPTIYGGGWDGLVDPGLVKGTYLPNDQLRRHYSSAEVVLNDHWADMAAHGFVSNRLFDAAACGARIVSDPVAGVDELFGEQVIVAEDGRFPVAALGSSATASGSSGVAGPSAFDVDEHSFARRARQLVATVDALQAARGTGRDHG